MFEEGRQGWTAEHAELRELLTDDEWREARRTTLNAHYTDPALAQAMWDGLNQLGFEGGRVIEPGSGSGTFIGLAPEDAQVTGIELDPATAAIASHLYPDADIRAESFAHTKVREGDYDAAIGNVPFASVHLPDATWNPDERFSLHNHFIAKSVGGLHPGGVAALMTSSYTLDARNPAIRREIARDADFLGAVRMPAGTHRRTAGTEAVTDIIFIRKRLPGEEPSPVNLEFERAHPVLAEDRQQGGEKAVMVNDYFDAHPERVLGTLGISGRFGNLTVHADDLDAIPQRLAEQITAITEQAQAQGRTYQGMEAEAEAAREERRENATSLWEGTVVERDGQFQVVDRGQLVDHPVAKTHQAEVRALIGLREQAVDLVRMQAETRTDTDQMVTARDELMVAWQGYVDRYGPVNRFESAWTWRNQENPETGAKERVQVERHKQPAAVKSLRADPMFSVMLAIEDFNPETQSAEPAAILRQRTVTLERRQLGAETAEEALTLALEHTGRADLTHIAGLLGTNTATARAELGDLVFDDPTTEGRIVPRAEYLSGNVRSKLDEARLAATTDERYAANVAALEPVIPTDVPQEDIEATVGAVWISAADHREFLAEISEDATVMVTNPGSGVWDVKPSPGGRDALSATELWGTDRRPVHDLFRSMLNKSEIQVKDKTETGSDVLNAEETEAARAKADEIATRFSEWVWEDPDRAGRLHQEYNRRFNSLVPRDYTPEAEAMSLPGLALNFAPHPHQKAAVARMIAEPSVGLFHEVGAGKTAVMVMGSMELKRRGLVDKPAIVVPGHMLEQVTREWQQLYPQATLLSAGSDDMKNAKGVDGRRRFVAQATTGDWDGIVMTHAAFERLAVDAATERAYTQRVIADLEATLGNLRNAEGDVQDRTVKQIENRLVSTQAQLEKSLQSKTDQEGLTFEGTGIDYISVDEAHLFKNLRTVSGIQEANITGSSRATDMDMKIDSLRQRFGGRAVTMATGTPIANTIGEAHVMTRYLRPDLLREAGVELFDDWANTFGQTVSRVERDAAGRLRQKTRLSKFKNVPEMLGSWQQFADVVLTDDLDYLKRPKLVAGPDGKRSPEMVVITRSEALAGYMARLEERLDDLSGKAKPGEDNHLTVYSDGRKAALDTRLVDLDSGELTKIDVAEARIAAIWNATRENTYLTATGEPAAAPGALQLVFCDLSTPNPDRWNVYQQLRDDLATKHGMDPERIAFIHEAKDDEAKGKMFAAAREGGVDVLIGSSEKMGTGANIQDRAIALHHLDCPWRPAELTQREGRIIRQGNQHDEVQVLRYATENSFDSTAWDIITRKATAINQVMSGRTDVREIEDPGDMALDAQQLMAASSGNPYLVEQVELSTKVDALSRRERSHAKAQNTLRWKAQSAERNLASIDTHRAELTELIGRSIDTSGEKFTAQVGGRTYDSRQDASTAMRQAIIEAGGGGHLRAPRRTSDPHPIAEIGGHTFEVTFHPGTSIDPQQTPVSLRIQDATAPGTQIETTWREVKTSDINVALLAENRVSGLPRREQELSARIPDERATIEQANDRIGVPFKQADELTEARARLAEVSAKIAAMSNDKGPAKPDEGPEAGPTSTSPGPDGPGPRPIPPGIAAAADHAGRDPWGPMPGKITPNAAPERPSPDRWQQPGRERDWRGMER